jgi:AraC-like DNA-binding protein
MPRGTVIHEDFYETLTFAEAQLLSCTFSHIKTWDFKDLTAPFWRLYFNDRPGAFIVVDGKRMGLTPDKVVLIPPQTAFSSATTCVVGHLYLHFSLGLDRAGLPGIVHFHTPSAAEKNAINKLIKAMTGPDRGIRLDISFLAQALVGLALAAVPAGYWDGSVSDPRIERALRRIKATFPLAVSNAELACEARVNVNTFTRLFRQSTGYAPHEYLLRLRIERACMLLQHGSASMEAIATETGFCDRFHFSRIFKKQQHMSPAAFRRQSRHQPVEADDLPRG